VRSNTQLVRLESVYVAYAKLTLYPRSVSYFLDLDALIFALAADLKSRKMADEVALLRRLYAERKRRATGRPACDAITVIEWASMVGIAPFEHVFLQQTSHHRCPCWGKDRDRGRTQTKVFAASSHGPALTAHWCRACGAHWVVSGQV
jgi:hypothetical protein